jgi:hypothetical protein
MRLSDHVPYTRKTPVGGRLTDKEGEPKRGYVMPSP